MKCTPINKDERVAKQARITSFFVGASTSERPILNVSMPSPASDATVAVELDCTDADGLAVPHILASTSTSSRRRFQEQWCKDLPWLTYDRNTGTARCGVCAAFPAISDTNLKVVKGFSGPFKVETFKKHAKSLTHQRCVAAEKVRTPESSPLAKCMKRMDENMFQHMEILFNTAYYVAKHNKPFSDFPGLLELAAKLNVEMREEYSSNKMCAEFVSNIAHMLRQDLLDVLKKQNYVGLMLDASTDSSSVEELVLYARYIDDNDKAAKEVFLSIIPLENATAEGYFLAVEGELQKLGLLSLLSTDQFVGIGTDGAATMLGVEKGFVHQISKKLKHVVGIHCVAHRLQLSVLSAVKNGKHIDEIDYVSKSLYKFYQHSPKRMRQLKNVSNLLQMKIRKLQYLHSVRWVASKVGALTALVTDWKCVIVHLEDIKCSEDNNASATAKGLLKKLLQYQFVHMIHFLLNFLNVVKNLSLLFQRGDLLLSTVQLHVQHTISSLESLLDIPDKYEQDFMNKTSLQGMFQNEQLQGLNENISSAIQADKKSLVQDGVKYLKERFLKEEGSVEMCTSVFDTFTWPEGRELEGFGIKEIDILADHFQNLLASSDTDIAMMKDKILNEWYEFKVLGKGLSLNNLLANLITNKDRFPLLSKLLHIAVALPVSNVSCERGFSVMNLIKNNFRSSLGSDTLNNLMFIHMNGPPLKDVDLSRAVDHWFFSAKTTRHILGHKGHKHRGIHDK